MLVNRVNAFVTLGEQIKEALLRKEEEYDGLSKEQIGLLLAVKQAGFKNGWFTETSVKTALFGIAEILNKTDLLNFSNKYLTQLSNIKGKKEVGVVMAGNIPAVGFHDMFCVLLSGNIMVAKMSSDDEVLLPAIAQILISIDSSFEELIVFSKDPRAAYDAVIATGSNNSARYFEQYFGKYPNIIRQSRTSIAVLNGKETEEDIKNLGKDIFTYYGLGCRNISKLFFVGDVDPTWVIDNLVKAEDNLDLSKYQNNLDFNRSVYLLNKVKFLDAGNFLLKEDENLSSPLSVTFFERMASISDVELFIKNNRDSIQCIVGNCIDQGLPFGEAQSPKIDDFADGVDTVQFLIDLEK